MTREVLENVSLLKKYNQEYIINYSDYPSKDCWSYDMTSSDYKNALCDVYQQEDNLSSLLYVHSPFCEEICYFCFCSTFITQDYSKVKRYLDDYLLKELRMLRKELDINGLKPNIRQIYLGGGSPTYYRENEFLELISAIQELVNINEIDTFTIEIDPRRVDEEKLKFYKKCGVNRFSFGIQDFDLTVQQEINRVQPFELVQRLLTDDVREGLKAINFDLLVGLPNQTSATMSTTIDKVIQLQPDEVQVMFVHYKPKLRKHMTRMVRNGPLPDFFDRKKIFLAASEGLEETGYMRAGYESFCRQNRLLADSVSDKDAYYNSLGTQPQGFVSFIAVGSSGQGMIGEDYYFQNYYEQKKYREAVGKEEFPIHRGYRLSKMDKVRREIINQIRTYFRVDKVALERKYDIDFDSSFERELNILKEFWRDGLVEIRTDEIVLSQLGEHFCLQAAQVFDEYIKELPYTSM